MDTSRLLLAFLAFGAACTTLWAWMLANSGNPAPLEGPSHANPGNDGFKALSS